MRPPKLMAMSQFIVRTCTSRPEVRDWHRLCTTRAIVLNPHRFNLPLLLFSSFWLIGAAPGSMPAAGRAVTLAEALELSESQQPDLAAAKARLAVAEADVRASTARWVPSVGALAEFIVASANNSTASFVANPAIDIPRVGATAISPPSDYSPAMSSLVGVGIRQTVWDFGRASAQTAAAKYTSAIQQSRIDLTRTDVRFAVAHSFYSVLAARAVLTAATGSLERAKVFFEYVAAAVSRGMKAPVDRARSEADLARAEAALHRAEGGVRFARSVFATTIGAADSEVDAIAPLTKSANESTDTAFESRWEKARERDPLLQVARLRIDVQREEAAAARAQLYPTLFLSGSFTGRAGGAPTTAGQVAYGQGALPNVPNYHAGLILSWNAFDWVAISRMRSTEQQEAVTVAEEKAVVLRQRATLYQALSDLEVAQKMLVSQRKAAVAAQSNFTQIEQRYRAGLASLLERTDAESLLTDAEIQLAVSEFQVARAQLVLKRASAEDL
jgi:outer membrane protein